MPGAKRCGAMLMAPSTSSAPYEKWHGARRRAAIAGCVLLLAAPLTGCGGRSTEGTAQRYLDYLQEFNYPACYGMLSEQDKKDRDFSEFLTAIPLAPDTSPLWFRAVLHSTHYTLGGARLMGDRAAVAVKVTTPDLPRWERELDAAAGPDHIGGEEAARSLDTNDYPKLTYGDQIMLIREHQRWRVIAAPEARDHLMVEYRAAVALYDQSDFDGAAAAYRKLLMAANQEEATGVGQVQELAQSELARTEQIIRERPAAQAYTLKSLKLNDVAMKMSEDRVPGIFGSIANAGNRAIDQITLAVTWYEGRGSSLRQKFREQHTIVITPLQFTDFSRPVVPFQPGAVRGFGFILTAPPEVQQEASPYVTISAIAFAPIVPASSSAAARPNTSATPVKSPAPQASRLPSPLPHPGPRPSAKGTPGKLSAAP